MPSHSELLPEGKPSIQTYYGAVLIKEGAFSLLYRIARAGKYFIRKYRWISSKASNKIPDRRYTNVETFQKAIRRRNHPIFAAISAIIITIICFTGVSFGKKFHELKEFLQQEIAKKEFRDSGHDFGFGDYID